VHATALELDAAVEQTRTGDIWLFRGTSGADRAIRVTTNSPVNHVGMAVVLDDLQPLMWHAELGKSLPDMWTGSFQRGVQLHDLRSAVLIWATRYGQRGWLRQLSPAVTSDMEDGALRAIARLDGTPFPSTARLAGRWLSGRVPMQAPRRMTRRMREPRTPAHQAALETAYCAEVVAMTYQMMGLLPADQLPNHYDPGSFWSGDKLRLASGYQLGGELPIALPDSQ
jgi:hypothetical protein